MTVVVNDPTWLPFISGTHLSSYFVVVSSFGVVYDWALKFEQEVELVWMQRWSFMTVLYICVRYIGILYSAPYLTTRVNILSCLPVTITDAVGFIFYLISTFTPVVVDALLGAIMMIRIHAMYGRSKKMLVFLIVVLLASTIASSVIMVMANIGVTAEEFVVFGYYICLSVNDIAELELHYENLTSTAIWETLAFVLAVWIVIKHLRELRESPTGSTIGDCFAVLIRSHAFYFAAFAVVTCFTLGLESINIRDSTTVGSSLYSAVHQIAQVLQMFVLGPRLILNIREYHAKLVARYDERTGMTSIRFQAGDDALTGGVALTVGDVQ
ncbi:hypothetical protein F4604DRAFT_1902555 [Suillus subluteus]|nr:hypothetical protein F4604DRAFT_1902555 [Suillus subluteus]